MAPGLRKALTICNRDTPMPIVPLPDRTVVRVTGPDAEHFLQNILTIDLDALPERTSKAGALLTPQGKILFDFLIGRIDDGFRLDVRADIADDFVRRLMLYKLRAKVGIARDDAEPVHAAWDSDAAEAVPGAIRDGRFPESNGVLRIYGPAREAVGQRRDYEALRIRHGIAESGADYSLGDAFPHDVLLDQVDGVGFRKGCYVGQEVVSRMHHRGTARRRVLLARGESALPVAGKEIMVADRPVGVLGSTGGEFGLALVRIDRVKDAMDAGTPILAGGVALSLAIPDWARFSFPAADATEA